MASLVSSNTHATPLNGAAKPDLPADPCDELSRLRAAARKEREALDHKNKINEQLISGGEAQVRYEKRALDEMSSGVAGVFSWFSGARASKENVLNATEALLDTQRTNRVQLKYVSEAGDRLLKAAGQIECHAQELEKAGYSERAKELREGEKKLLTMVKELSSGGQAVVGAPEYKKALIQAANDCESAVNTLNKTETVLRTTRTTALVAGASFAAVGIAAGGAAVLTASASGVVGTALTGAGSITLASAASGVGTATAVMGGAAVLSNAAEAGGHVTAGNKSAERAISDATKASADDVQAIGLASISAVTGAKAIQSIPALAGLRMPVVGKAGLRGLAGLASAGGLACLTGCPAAENETPGFISFPAPRDSWWKVSDRIENPRLEPNLSGEQLAESIKVEPGVSRTPRYFYGRDGIRVAIADDYRDSGHLRFTDQELNVIAAALDVAPLKWLKLLNTIQSKEMSAADPKAGSASVGESGVITLYIEPEGKFFPLMRAADSTELHRTITSHPELHALMNKETTTMRVAAGTPLYLHGTVLHELGHLVHYSLLEDATQGPYWRTLNRLSGKDRENYASEYATTNIFEDFAETVERYTADSAAQIKDALSRSDQGEPIYLMKLLFVMSQSLNEDRSQIDFYTPHPSNPTAIHELKPVTAAGDSVTVGPLLLGLNDQGLVSSCEYGGQKTGLAFPGYFAGFDPQVPVAGAIDLVELYNARPEVIRPTDPGVFLERAGSSQFSFITTANRGEASGGARLSGIDFDRYLMLDMMLLRDDSPVQVNFTARFLFNDGTVFDRAFEQTSAVDYPALISRKYDLEREFGEGAAANLRAVEILIDPNQTVNITAARLSPDPHLMLLNGRGDTYYDRRTNRAWFPAETVEAYLNEAGN